MASEHPAVSPHACCPPQSSGLLHALGGLCKRPHLFFQLHHRHCRALGPRCDHSLLKRWRLVIEPDQCIPWPTLTLVLAAIIPWTTSRLRMRKSQRSKSSKTRAMSSLSPEDTRRLSQSEPRVHNDETLGIRLMLICGRVIRSLMLSVPIPQITPLSAQDLVVPRISLPTHTGTLRPSSLTKNMRHSTGAPETLPPYD